MIVGKGDKVTFIDQGNVALDSDEPVLVDGVVNGDPIDQDGVILIPTWVHRDRDREPTTVYVDSKNILTIEESPR